MPFKYDHLETNQTVLQLQYVQFCIPNWNQKGKKNNNKFTHIELMSVQCAVYSLEYIWSIYEPQRAAIYCCLSFVDECNE